MIYSKEILVVLFSYVLGCISGGYYLTLLVTGKDIRTFGSAGTGARNVGRVLGRSGFIAAFLIDMSKGLIVAGAGLALHIHPWAVMASLIAVLCGHIWPIQLGFRGGRGITVLIGFLLVFDFWILAGALAIFGLCLLLPIKSVYEIAVFIGLAAMPLITFFTGHSKLDIYGILIAVIIILLAHREYLLRLVRKFLKS